jgi:hypothetical protein
MIHQMDSNEKPHPLVLWLSIIHVIYLMSLPVLANITIASIVYPHTVNAVFWGIFGLLGMPIAFAGMMSLNPFPRDIFSALMRAFFLPVTAGIWWWIQEGSLIEYFAVMLVYEFLAIYLSIFLMYFIPLTYYDPNNPKAGNARTYWNILIFQGFLGAGGFIIALILAIWPWAKNDSFWYNPITYIFLLIAAIQYIYSNFQWHRINSDRWEGQRKRTALVPDNTVSIEPVLLFIFIPWLISFGFINK